jgi:hypothetical protein
MYTVSQTVRVDAPWCEGFTCELGSRYRAIRAVLGDYMFKWSHSTALQACAQLSDTWTQTRRRRGHQLQASPQV